MLTQQQTPDTFDLVFLNPTATSFRHAENRLQMQVTDETEWRDVTLLRLYPLSEPHAWISVQNSEGKELGVIRELKEFPPDALALLRQELDRRYMVPVIIRVLGTTEKFDIVTWLVETTRGPVSFYTNSWQRCIQQPVPGRFTITDLEGNRYDILDIHALDAESQKILKFRM